MDFGASGAGGAQMIWLTAGRIGKLAIAERLPRETTLPIKAIAARVRLGTYNTANALLHRV